MSQPAPSSRTRRRRRRWPLVLVGVLVVLLVAAVAGGYSYYQWCRGASGEQSEIDFTVPKGTTGNEVASQLYADGVTRCDAVGRYLASRASPEGFDAGDYKLTTNMTPDAAFDVLAAGPIVKTIDVTIPEGWRLSQITDELARRLHIPPAELQEAAERGPGLTPYLPAETTTEGFLFPKTYTFPKEDVTAQQAIDTLLAQFEEEVAALDWSRAKQLGVSPYEVVTIASLIEREARVPSERSRIAAVIYNRLERGEILGIDASNMYIDPDPSDGLTDADLAIDSPYNLRQNPGKLPPTPIASPGLASLKAALNPAATDDWLYVLCGEDGHHEFTASYPEFESLKARCLG